MNGSLALDDDLIDEDEDLERHLTDYSIDRDLIYAAFSWSLTEEAYDLMMALAKKHNLGFFDLSEEDGDIILADGSLIE